MKITDVNNGVLGKTAPACVVLICLTLIIPAQVEAQMEGPRVYLLAPVDMNVLVGTYMDMSGNLNFSGTILVKDADISADISVLTYMRYFSIGNHFAQLWVAPVWGKVGGSLGLDGGIGPESINIPSISGFADPYVAMLIGLVGAPALKMSEFVRYRQVFQLHALVSAYLPVGDYDSSRPLNLGTNRWAVRLGLPMVVPFGAPLRSTWLEIIPSINFFTDNKDPFGADVREQDNLFSLESHLSHNFTARFWGSVDFRYQNGGETTTDGLPDDNRMNQFGAGVSLGYSITPAWTLQTTYGEIIAENNDARGRNLRLRLSYVF